MSVTYAKGYKWAEKCHCKLEFRSDLISCPAVRLGRIEFLSDWYSLDCILVMLLL